MTNTDNPSLSLSLSLARPGGGPVPHLRQEGVGLQQLVRERGGGPDGPGALQLSGGDPGAARGPRCLPLLPELGAGRLRPAGRAGPADQELPGGVQPLHLVHHGGPGGDLEEPAEDHQGMVYVLVADVHTCTYTRTYMHTHSLNSDYDLFVFYHHRLAMVIINVLIKCGDKNKLETK